ncbi:MAG: hypothetical protein WCZ18_03040 [Ottowia sp.]|nr:hypothetical protein [Ottowia sp.]
MYIRHAFLVALLAAGSAAWAQSPPPAQEPAPAATARDGTQRLEHLHVEDAGSRIDEERYGGETRSINVQPKAAVPPYQVRPRDPYSREAGPGRTGERTWKILDF